jgi:choline kinase
MKGIIIAAGRGLRLRPYTDAIPKCMLAVNGQPLLFHTIAALRGAGCTDIVVVTGHQAERIDAPGCRTVRNTDYENNNILHSLMYAREDLDDDVCVTYSDIVVEPRIHQRLTATPGDIVAVVDKDWRGYYEGRTEHPANEAEKALVAVSDEWHGRVIAMGKHLEPAESGPWVCGEFPGLWKMTRAGARRFRAHFETLDAVVSPLEPFQAAKEWRKAYITDFLTDLIAAGTRVDCLIIERGWAELDTVQDYDRLPTVATRQRLISLGYDA